MQSPCSPACAAPQLRGTGDLGVVIERATGRVEVVETTGRSVLGKMPGLGDLSHASLNYSRDGRFAYVFGRDGGLTKIDLLEMRIVKRVMQSGNSIGGAISQDGKLVAVANYTPGGVKVFDATTSRSGGGYPRAGRDRQSSPRWWGWWMRRVTASCGVCSKRGKSGWRICKNPGFSDVAKIQEYRQGTL